MDVAEPRTMHMLTKCSVDRQVPELMVKNAGRFVPKIAGLIKEQRMPRGLVFVHLKPCCSPVMEVVKYVYTGRIDHVSIADASGHARVGHAGASPADPWSCSGATRLASVV